MTDVTIASRLWKTFARLGKPGLIAGVALAAPSISLAQYTYVPSSNQSGNWNSAARWTGGPAGTFPNATGASATFNLPGSTAPSGSYNVQLGQTITVGAITVNHDVASPNTFRIGANGSGSLIFQSPTGTATYTENPGTPDSTFRTDIFAPVVFASNTVISQNHNLDNNRSTLFSSTNNSPGGISAAPGITLTKTGAGNISFEIAPTLPTGGFRGTLAVNQGGVRIEDNVFANAEAVTVGNGGQFQLGSGSVENWSLASGAVLTLNGQGKAIGVNPEGALRFQNGGNSANFNNAVTLASNSSVYVNANSATAKGHLTLTETVSGAGGLTKTGPGVLSLAAANTYEGATAVDDGLLLAVNSAGSATGAGSVAVLANGALGGIGSIAGNVNFDGGTLTPGTSVGTLSLGETAFNSLSTLIYELSTPNVIGGGINDLTNVNGNLTLDGTLNVTQLAGFGLGSYRLFNYTGQLVDNGLDLNVGTLPDGWIASIDSSIANQVNLNIAVVPEPSTFALVAMGGVLLSGARLYRGRRRATIDA